MVGGGVTGGLIVIAYFVVKEMIGNWKRKDQAEDETIKTFIASTTSNKNKMLDMILTQQSEMTHDVIRKNQELLDSIHANQVKVVESQASLISLIDTVGINSAQNSVEIKNLLVRLDNFTQGEMNRFLMAQTGYSADVIRKFTIIEKSLEALHLRVDGLSGRATIKTMPLPGAEDDEL